MSKQTELIEAYKELVELIDDKTGDFNDAEIKREEKLRSKIVQLEEFTIPEENLREYTAAMSKKTLATILKSEKGDDFDPFLQTR